MTVRTVEISHGASSPTFSGPAALSLERVLAQFEPIREWRVIGPFPRTTPSVFLGEPSIDFARAHTGAAGRSSRLDAPPGRGPAPAASTWRTSKQGAGDEGGFGYDTSGSPDLCAFAYAEVEADRDGPGLMLVGSSGTMIVTVNEQPVYQYADAAGRGYAPDTDSVRFELRKGKNRILVRRRQGIGAWCFGVQVAWIARGRAGSVGHGHRSWSCGASRSRTTAIPGTGRRSSSTRRESAAPDAMPRAGRGTATIGPDLTGLALKYDRAEVIRSVLEPSNRIAPGYQPVVVATRDGKVATGVVRSETDEALELADSEARITRIPKSDIDVRRAGDVSIMPARSVETLSPAEFADLISYLMSLKQAPDPKPAPVSTPTP